AYPVLPPAAWLEPPRPRVEAAPASAPYRAASTQVLRLFSGFTLGPDGNAWQVGLHGTDVVGQLDWVARGSFGHAGGPRGGGLAGQARPPRLRLPREAGQPAPGATARARPAALGLLGRRLLAAPLRLGKRAGGGRRRLDAGRAPDRSGGDVLARSRPSARRGL